MKTKEMVEINRRKLTEHGVLIKHSLIERKLSQAQFCRTNGVNQQMFTDVLYSERYPRLRKRIMKLLGIKEAA